MSKLNIRKDYFKPGEHHVCRFCSTPIGKVDNQGMSALANKGHGVILLKTGTVHRFNCCKQCLKSIDFSQPGVLQQVWELDCEVWRDIELKEGESLEDANRRMEDMKSMEVVEDFFFAEMELSQGGVGANKAKARFAKGVS